MKKTLAIFASLCVFLALAFVGPAVAKHKDGHHRPPACDKKSELTDSQDKKKGNKKGKKGNKKGRKGNKNRRPNQKHCYPPSSSSPNARGARTAFEAPAPQRSGGLTVGMATIAAVGALGALLLLRRRWVFRPGRGR
ncbi:MAG: hypothetical protein ACRDH9_03425 [Actinomycetota bacterium]